MADYGQTGFYGQVACGTSATKIIPENRKRYSALITNAGAATIYLGTDASVTTSTGYPLAAGQTYETTMQTDIYGVVASSTVTAAYLVESE